MRRCEDCDQRCLDQLRVRLVHTAIGSDQKPALTVAQLDNLRVFYSLCRVFRFIITKMICETLYTRIASILETFAIRLTESSFKKENARFVVFFDQSGLMLV